MRDVVPHFLKRPFVLVFLFLALSLVSFSGVRADSSGSCSFPDNGFNEAGYTAIYAACQKIFGAQANSCLQAGNALDCSYSNQTLAFNCGMPGAGQGGLGYCLPSTPAGSDCIGAMSEAALAQAVGASCGSVSTGGTTTGGTTTGGTTTGGTTTGGSTVSGVVLPALNSTAVSQSPARTTGIEAAVLSFRLQSPQSSPAVSSGGVPDAAPAIPPAISSPISAFSSDFAAAPIVPVNTTESPMPIFSINGTSSGAYAIGSPWLLSLVNAPASTTFTFCASINGSQSCTRNWATTDAKGSWHASSTFASGTEGSWLEWIVLPSGIQSNVISFSVGNIAGVQGYNPVPKTYTTNTAVQNTYLLLYGEFSPIGNVVTIDGSTVSTTFQGINQINISLSGISLGSHTVKVVTASSTIGYGSFTITTASSTSPVGSSSSTSSGGSASSSVSIPSTPAGDTVIGPYFWGGTLTGITGSNILTQGVQLAESLGATSIRISMSPASDINYIGGSCIPNFTLTNLAKRSDFNAILSNPQFTTIDITANDGVSYGNCNTESFLDPNFYTAANTQAIESEYTTFANYLKQFHKTFIISNWEGDNNVYCGSSYGVAHGTVSCSSAANNLAGIQKWLQARHAGIAAAGASNVFDAVEFNSVTALKNANLPSILYNVIPNVNPDYVSYSSYESINVSAAQLSTDIDTIRGVVHGTPLLIGEMGFQVGAFGNASATAQRLSQMINIIQTKSNVPYAFVWALLDYPTGFGLYNTSGNITTSGALIRGIESGSSHGPIPLITASAPRNAAAVVSSSVNATGTAITFPAIATVTASSVNVRSGANTSAALVGSKTLVQGQKFTVTGEVIGQSVAGNDEWLISSLGNYVWSGGVTVQ